MKDKPIGVFDSGLGGLTVVSKIQELLPDETILYLGDTARVPYGTKSQETIKKFSLQNASFLISKGIKCLVVACNSASAYSIELLRKKYPQLLILGVIEAGVCQIIREGYLRVGIIGTTATIKSKKYPELISQENSKVFVFEKACPLFVPLVEEGLLEGAITEAIIHHYIADLKQNNLQALVLGCTHYPLLASSLQKAISRVNFIDSGKSAAVMLQQRLEHERLLCNNKQGALFCYLTSQTEHFETIASKCLTKGIDALSYIEMD